MKQFVRRTGGRIGLWGGLLAAALAAFAAGWLVPVRAPVGCKLNELTAAPDFSPFSPAAPAVGYIRCRYARRPFPAGKMGLPDL
ncbi:MAG: hypothetical protein ACLVJH_09185 [Faecalibacterium prausnitzii]